MIALWSRRDGVTLVVRRRQLNHEGRHAVPHFRERHRIQDLVADAVVLLAAEVGRAPEVLELHGLERLAEVLRGLPTKVNLIPMNPIAASSLHAPRPEAVEAFRRELGRLHVSCSVRQTRGDDVDAACGQLALAQG